MALANFCQSVLWAARARRPAAAGMDFVRAEDRPDRAVCVAAGIAGLVEPWGRQITLAVARHPATDRANKVGTLMFLPGAGVSVVNQVATPVRGGLGLAEDLVRRFDIVGIDPRGGGLDLTWGRTTRRYTARR
jgi:hypothetical protein